MVRSSVRLQGRCSGRGFSLLELGIAIAVLAVMVMVVISARGFITSAKIGSTVQTVDTLKKASRAWAERKSGGTGFVSTLGVPVSIAELQAADLIPAGSFETPWGDAITLAPNVNPEFFDISFNLPDADVVAGCTSALAKTGTVSSAGLNLTVRAQ